MPRLRPNQVPSYRLNKHVQRQLESSTTKGVFSSLCVAPVERSETGATHTGEPERPAAVHLYREASDPAAGGEVPFDFFACSTR